MILKVFDDTRGPGECRSCHAPIVWFELATTGKRMPLDGDPVYVKTELDPATHRLIGYVDASVTPSHFSSCPDHEAVEEEAINGD
jgi:hypothetical protein